MPSTALSASAAPSTPARSRRRTRGTASLRTALLTCLALAWLNPHVYLDTVGLIGAVSTGFPGWSGKLAYGSGATLASFVFFFGLGYGARLLAPVFARPAPRCDVSVGCSFGPP